MIYIIQGYSVSEAKIFIAHAFKTEDEARRFCKDKTDKNVLYSFQPVYVGSYPRKPE